MKLNFPYQSNTSSVYYDLNISPIGKAIYSVIVNEVTNCNNQPSQTFLASILGISVKSVYTHIQPLIEHGYITSRRNAGHATVYGLIPVSKGDEYKANRNRALAQAHELKESDVSRVKKWRAAKEKADDTVNPTVTVDGDTVNGSVTNGIDTVNPTVMPTTVNPTVVLNINTVLKPVETLNGGVLACEFVAKSAPNSTVLGTEKKHEEKPSSSAKNAADGPMSADIKPSEKKTVFGSDDWFSTQEHTLGSGEPAFARGFKTVGVVHRFDWNSVQLEDPRRAQKRERLSA